MEKHTPDPTSMGERILKCAAFRFNRQWVRMIFETVSEATRQVK